VGAVLALVLATREVLLAGWQPSQVLDSELEGGMDVGAASLSACAQIAGEILAGVGEGPVRASSKAQAIARQAGLDLRTVTDSGSGWGVVAEDVSQALATRAAVPKAKAQTTPVAANTQTI
jgi:hypothetical protein